MREQILEEARSEFGDIEQRFGPGSYGLHEIVDRTFMIQNLWELVKNHPSCCLSPELFALAEEIENKLQEFYVAAQNLNKRD